MVLDHPDNSDSSVQQVHVVEEVIVPAPKDNLHNADIFEGILSNDDTNRWAIIPYV